MKRHGLEKTLVQRFVQKIMVGACVLILVACSTSSPGWKNHSADGLEVVMFAMGLMDTGYRFGGKNPEAGLDCSGMVSFVFREAVNYNVTGSAAQIAKAGRVIPGQSLRLGDLVFFNTQNSPHSHVGIYIGEGRFVHAPSTNGKIRVDRLDNPYFASRFHEARTYFD